jgi:hypothetical protein
MSAGRPDRMRGAFIVTSGFRNLSLDQRREQVAQTSGIESQRLGGE